MNLVIKPLADEHKREVINGLIEYGKTIEFSAEVRRALDEKCQSQNSNGKEMKESFYRLERHDI